MMEKKMQEAESFKAVRKQTLEYSGAFREKGITLIAFAISRKCVRYEERA